jgi:hypothetical protein
MRMERILIQVPKAVKARLDGLRAEGYSVAGFVRRAIERELASTGKRPRR